MNLAIAFIILIAAQAQAAPLITTLTYRETTGDNVRTTLTTILYTSDSIVVESESPTFSVRHVVEKNFSSRRWYAQSTQDNFEITAGCEGADIVAKGMLKEKPIAKRTPAGKRIWYQEPTLPLGAWARTGEKSITFWMVMVFNGELFKFIGHNKGTANITIDNKTTPCIQVRINLAGAMALLWSGEYYFRATDGRLIKYEGATRPGAPKTTYELINEE